MATQVEEHTHTQGSSSSSSSNSRDMSAGLRLGGCPSAGSASTCPTGRRTLLVSKNLQAE